MKGCAVDLRDFGSTLARWWHLSIITLLAAIGAGVGAYAAASPSYTATSTVLLMPPKAVLVQAQADKSQYAPNNPLLYLDTLLNSRDVLVRNLSAKDVADQLKKQVPAAEVTVAGDPLSNSPLIIVKSVAGSKDGALAGMKAVDAMVPQNLKKLQDDMGILELQRITSINVTEDTAPAASAKKQIELAAVAFALVMLLGLALIATLDQLRARRAARAGSTPAVEGTDEAPAAAVTSGATKAARGKGVRKGDRA